MFGNTYDLGIKSDRNYYDCIFYDLDEFFQPAFILYFAASGDTGVEAKDNHVAGVESVVQIRNDDGDLEAKITAYYNGVKGEYKVNESETTLYNLALSLRKGDFIQFSADYKNEITDLKFFFTYNLDSFDFNRIKAGGDIKNHFDATSRNILFNKVKNANDTFILFEGDPTLTNCTGILHYEWPSGNYMTLYDGESFSRIQMKDVEVDDVVFGAFDNTAGFHNIVILRDVDLTLVEPNIIMP